MLETEAELDALQELLDRSRSGATGHLRGIIDDQRALSTKHLGFTVSPHEECGVEEAVQIVEREGGSSTVLTLGPAEQKAFPKTGLQGFYIDGNITRLDDTPAGGSSETSCDVKVMVARWPSKSIILWTNAGASLQSGNRPQDKVSARKDCLEASAGQLAEDLGKFFKAQGG